jgi:hypothetical protein
LTKAGKRYILINRKAEERRKEKMIIKFETGKTYKTVRCGDFTILKRTSKTVTVIDQNDKPTVRRIYIYENCECVKPFGNYSMAPVLRADRNRIKGVADHIEMKPQLNRYAAGSVQQAHNPFCVFFLCRCFNCRPQLERKVEE